MYAAGKIPGSFFRREGRPSEDAILTCRLIDRPLRPSFKKGLRNEIQVVATIMALNPDHLYDVVAINAASASTQLAGLPFSGPIGGVRVALIRGQWVAFPTHTELEDAVFDMVVAGRVLEDGDVAIMMVEAEATEKTIKLVEGGAEAPTEEVVAAGLEAAKPFIKVLCRAQADLAAKAAKPTAEFPIFLDYQDDVFEALTAAVKPELAQALTIAGKQEREAELDRVKGLAAEKLLPEFEGREKEISAAYRSLTKQLVRERVIKEKKRIDGRGLTDIRTLAAEVEAIPRVHGSRRVRAWRDPDPGRHHPQHAPHGAAAGHPLPGDPQALHAQLQLPAVLHRRDRPRRLPEAPRDRPRRPRRARPDPGPADARGVPLRDPSGLRGAQLQRLDVHGLGLRLHHVAAERRCAAEGPGRRYRHGSDLPGDRRRDALRHPHRHPRCGRTPSATWTSRSPAPRSS